MTPTRILICGGPRTGKTTEGLVLARELGVALRSTDNLMAMGWSEASLVASTWLDEPGPWVIEGVAVVRAVRKWMRGARPLARIPADLLLWRGHALCELNPGQESLAKGCITIMRSIAPDLFARGLRIDGWTG